MNIIIFGAAGFIGKNLVLKLMQSVDHHLTLVDKSRVFFSDIYSFLPENVVIKEEIFCEKSDFDTLLEGQDLVFHLVSTTVPVTSNRQIPQELKANVVVTAELLEACIRRGIKKVIFFSSGGTVYGKEVTCPIHEEIPAYPICSYGMQKAAIEKLLHLYWCMYGLDYRIIRLSNPYGPYQRPDGILGAVTTFTYKALKGEEIIVYGDGSVVRDFIYIEDALRAIMNIVRGESEKRIFNIGCGYGTSITQVIEIIRSTLGKKINVLYQPERKIDVPENYLDISRYESCYGKLKLLSLQEGIRKTAEFMHGYYGI